MYLARHRARQALLAEEEGRAPPQNPPLHQHNTTQRQPAPFFEDPEPVPVVAAVEGEESIGGRSRRSTVSSFAADPTPQPSRPAPAPPSSINQTLVAPSPLDDYDEDDRRRVLMWARIKADLEAERLRKARMGPASADQAATDPAKVRLLYNAPSISVQAGPARSERATSPLSELPAGYPLDEATDTPAPAETKDQEVAALPRKRRRVRKPRTDSGAGPREDPAAPGSTSSLSGVRVLQRPSVEYQPSMEERVAVQNLLKPREVKICVREGGKWHRYQFYATYQPLTGHCLFWGSSVDHADVSGAILISELESCGLLPGKKTSFSLQARVGFSSVKSKGKAPATRVGLESPSAPEIVTAINSLLQKERDSTKLPSTPAGGRNAITE